MAINLSGTTIANTITGTTGTYNFTGLLNGSYTVTPTKASYTFSPASRPVNLAGVNATADFTTAGFLIITLPNGGENWAVGSLQTIRWSFEGNLGFYVKIQLLKGGALVSTITDFAWIGTGGTGSWMWFIPTTQIPGNDYTVQINSTSNPAAYTDRSDANFTITGTAPPAAPTITVNSPNGTENWAMGSTQNITWTYTGNPGSNVRIELLKAGAPVRTITGSTPTANRSLNWLVPNDLIAGTDYMVRITSTTNGAYTDTSNANFTISAAPAAAVTVTDPNGGQTYARNSLQIVRWTSTGNPGNYLKIYLIKGTQRVRTITEFAWTGTGYWYWVVPFDLQVGSDYKIEIQSSTNTAITDMSNNPFTIN